MDSKEDAAKFVQERKALIEKMANEYEENFKETVKMVLSRFPKKFDMDSINAAMDIFAENDASASQKGKESKIFAGLHTVLFEKQFHRSTT